MGTKRQRREFLRNLVGWGLGVWGLAQGGCATRSHPPVTEGSAQPSTPPTTSDAPTASKRAKVVVVRDPKCIRDDGTLHEERLRTMLAQALCELSGERSPEAAWQHYVTPTDVVGLKLNCLAGRGLSTHVELVRALAAGLAAAGVKESNIIAWDRTDRELRQAGFEIRDGGAGFRCFGTDHVGYDPKLVVKGKIGGLLSSILTVHTTALINVPVLKDHGLAGVSGCLKNNFGCIHNPNKYHPNNCDPYIADLNSLPQIRDKQRLIICDATRLQYHGGPGFKPQWAEPYGALLLSTDPVALDTVGAKIIADLRATHNLPSLEEENRPPKHIATAASAAYHLGVAEGEKIEVVERTV